MSEFEPQGLKHARAASEAWTTVERARHPNRPSPLELIKGIFQDYSEVHGDRAFGDDQALACGMARLGDEQVMVVGTRKGNSLKERVKTNFGMPSPEGYRKALRCMKLAEKFGRPVISIIDLIGAYPGPASEERGVAEAIARNLVEMSRLRVPTLSVISGEGGSGGALGLAVADRVLLLENAVYFVAAPEFAAGLAWKDLKHKDLAAAALRISAPEVLALGCVDEIVPEPASGAQSDHETAIAQLGSALKRQLADLRGIPLEDLIAKRQQKFRNIGQFYGGESHVNSLGD